MRTIAAKLTRIYLIVAVSVLFSTCLISQVYLYLHARVVAHENLNTQAVALAGNLESAVTFADARFAQQTLNALQHYPDVLGAAVILPDGKSLANYAIKGRKEGTEDLPKYLAQGEFMTADRHGVSHMIALQEEIPGRLVIVASLERINREALQLLGASIVISALILFASFKIFSRLTRTITRPIENLTEVMRTIELDKDYSRRTAVVSDDEIGELAKGFNAVLSSLEKQSFALNNELKERIRIEAQILATKKPAASHNRCHSRSDVRGRHGWPDL